MMWLLIYLVIKKLNQIATGLFIRGREINISIVFIMKSYFKLPQFVRIIKLPELFIRDRNLNISLVFITQSYFAVPKNVTLNSMNYFIMKIASKRASKNPFDHSSDRDFINLYKKCTEKPCSFLVIATPLASDNPLRFRKNLLERT